MRISQALFIYQFRDIPHPCCEPKPKTCCSLMLVASMLAYFKSNPIKASRTALEVRPV